MIKAFKLRAKAIFSLLEKTHPPGSQNWVREIFSLFYIISIQRSYIHQKLDTNSCFSKLRANSYLFSFFYTPCIINRTLHGGLKIWPLSSRVKNNILLLVKYCFHHSKIKVISSHRRVISSIYYNVHDLKSIFKHVRNPLKTNMS
jgi:hypothetical protein